MKYKHELRRQILKIRSQLPLDIWLQKSTQISHVVIQHPSFKSASIIYIYIDYKQEVSTRLIIKEAWKLNKTVAVPKIINGRMSFYQINSFDDLKPGTFGILEPFTNQLISSNEGLMIMPGVVFDTHCHRIGYGKGFYDRYLSHYPTLERLALAFDLQIVDYIESESHDINPHSIITESKIYNEKKE